MKEIKLSNSTRSTMVDDDDYESLNQHRWCLLNNRYAARHPKKKENIPGTTSNSLILMHRVILDAFYGKHVDHIDHNGLNNQRSNLRQCTHTENLHNHINKAGNYIGVSNVGSRFRARFYYNNKDYSLGFYPTAEEAAFVINVAIVLYRDKHATLNDLGNGLTVSEDRFLSTKNFVISRIGVGFSSNLSTSQNRCEPATF